MDFDALKTFVGEQTAAFIVILLAVLVGLVFIIIYVIKINNWVCKVNRYPCDGHAEAIRRHTEEVTAIRTDLSNIDGKLSVVLNVVSADKTPQIITDTFSQKRSPRRLNDNGERLYAEIEGERFINENLPFFIAEIEKLTPKTALDVENYCMAILKVNSNADIFVPLKNWVYKAPAQEMYDEDGIPTGKKEVTFEDVLFVLSIPLRDKYLKNHPELNV